MRCRIAGSSYPLSYAMHRQPMHLIANRSDRAVSQLPIPQLVDTSCGHISALVVPETVHRALVVNGSLQFR